MQVIEVDDVAGHCPLGLFGQYCRDLEDWLLSGSEPNADGVQKGAVGQRKILGAGLEGDSPVGKAGGHARTIVILNAHESLSAVSVPAPSAVSVPALLRPSSARICSVC